MKRFVAVVFAVAAVLWGCAIGHLPYPAVAELPQFPWPVPSATTTVPIPRQLVARPLGTGELSSATVDRLGVAGDSIEKALRRAGMDFAVYAIGDSGFAYVTHTEMIRTTGEPVPPPDRFPNDVRTAYGSAGLLDLIISRFRARPGYFRIIAIVATSRPLVSSSRPLTLDSATALFRGGMARLPSALRDRNVRGLECAAFIYEFERQSATDSMVVQRLAPLVNGRAHLASAGLWTIAQLSP